MGLALILFLDANVLIYQHEGSPAIQRAITTQVKQWLGASTQAQVYVCRLAVMECCVKPLREGDTLLLNRYRQFFASAQIIELTAAVVESATQLRALHGLKTPDALHAACALTLPASTLFLSADTVFQRVAGLQVRLFRI